MFNKKAQITFFIFLGILILIFLSVFYFDNSDSTFLSQSEFKSEVDSFKQYLSECAKLATHNNIALIGLRGGYINLQEPYFTTLNFSTNYLYYDGKDQVPNITTVRAQLSLGVSHDIKQCINLTPFPNVEFIINNDPTILMEFDKESTLFLINWNIIVQKDSFSFPTSEFTINYPISLLSFIDTAQKIVDMTKANPDFIDVAYLLQQDVNTTIVKYSNDTLVYQLTKPDNTIDGLPYYFIFASKVQ